MPECVAGTPSSSAPIILLLVIKLLYHIEWPNLVFDRNSTGWVVKFTFTLILQLPVNFHFSTALLTKQDTEQDSPWLTHHQSA